MDYCVKMVLLTAILLGTFKATTAAVYTVDWILPSSPTGEGDFNYTTMYPDPKNYTVGDVLVFKYRKRFHSVLMVTESAFAACNTSEPLRQWKDSNTTIVLDREGMWYFICGTGHHCEMGQGLAAHVSRPPKILLSPAPVTPPPVAAGNSLRKSSQTAFTLAGIFIGASYLLQPVR